MNDYSILGFVIACGICLFLCWIAYRIFLEYKTSPKSNRIIIMSIFLLMLIIPLAVNIHVPQPVSSMVLDVADKINIDGMEGETSVSIKEGSKRLPINFLWIYMIGVGVMVGIYLNNLVLLWKIHRLSMPANIDGIRVYLHERNDLATFSWLNRIYVNKEILNIKEEERKTFLIHELSHIKNYHYLDLIIAQAIITFQWFNPAAWLFQKEIKMIHEYEADDNVIASGIDVKEYQYLLVTNLEKMKYSGMVHGFKGSSLKKRILMMQKENFSKSFRVSAIIILVAAFMAGYILRLPAVATSLKRPATALQISSTVNNNPESFLQPINDLMAMASEVTASQEIYANPDIFPEYGDGNDPKGTLMMDLVKMLTYPENAAKKGIQGKVVVSFVVNDKGRMERFQIQKSVDPELDKAALEGIKRLPKKWKPGQVDGKPVDCIFYLPVTFHMQ